MKPITKAIISLIVGVIAGIGYVTQITTDTVTVQENITNIFITMIVCFGYAFGWGLVKRVLANIGGTAVDISIFSLIISAFGGYSNPGFALFILLLIFFIALVFGWIPGVFYGGLQVIVQIVNIIKEKE